MFRVLALLASLLLLNVTANAQDVVPRDRDLTTLCREFMRYTGAELVFSRDELPVGRYHDILVPLADESSKQKAASVCLEEARMYPPGFFGDSGLKTIGVFAACVSTTTTDPSRKFDKQLGGYRYFGVYNGHDALAASMYSEGQLALTFHHELFHHIDSTVNGVTAKWQLSSDDAFYQAAVAGMRPYAAPPIAADDLSELRKRCIGYTLKDTVSDYAAKNSREDQAETARHVMSMLPNALVQTIEHPELAGSQRILHVFGELEHAVPDGPDFDWFVDVALDRAIRDYENTTPSQLTQSLKRYAIKDRNGYTAVRKDPSGVRAALKAVVRVNQEAVTPEQSAEFVRLATVLTEALLRERIRPDALEQTFDVWGNEDARGVNMTLRHDVSVFADDARRLKVIFECHASSVSLTSAQLKRMRLLARYYAFIKANWSVSPGTKSVFDSACQKIGHSLDPNDSAIAQTISTASLLELAAMIDERGTIILKSTSDES